MYLESFLRVQEISLDQLAQICHKNLIQLYQTESSTAQVKAKARKVCTIIYCGTFFPLQNETIKISAMSLVFTFIYYLFIYC